MKSRKKLYVVSGYLCPSSFIKAESPFIYREYDERRNAISKTEPRKPYKKCNTLTQFLENDGKVLRFYGYWHDGLDKRKLVIIFFLGKHQH